VLHGCSFLEDAGVFSPAYSLINVLPSLVLSLSKEAF